MISIDTSMIVTSEDKAKQARDAARAEAKRYLADTDWYVSRLAETGKAIPADILAARQEARAAANEDD